MATKDLTGMKFGRLTVIARAENYISPTGDKTSQKTRWLCKCDCGNPNKITVVSYSLTSGKTKSCGCIAKEKAKENGKKNKKYNTYDLFGEYGIGYTSNTNEPFYFDLEDYDKIKDYCWFVNSEGYIVGGKKSIKIHRLIMNCPSNKVIDHINHNKADNRKYNLRICNQSQNILNKSPSKRNTSGVTGVVYFYNKWRAQIKVKGRHISLGMFDNKEDAIKARKEAEAKYFGEYAYKGGDA